MNKAAQQETPAQMPAFNYQVPINYLHTVIGNVNKTSALSLLRLLFHI